MDTAADRTVLETERVIHPDNAASARVAAKAGLVREGETLRPSGVTRDVWALDRKDRPQPV